MSIFGEYHLPKITVAQIATVARGWGIPMAQARSRCLNLAERIQTEIQQVTVETPAHDCRPGGRIPHDRLTNERSVRAAAEVTFQG